MTDLISPAETLVLRPTWATTPTTHYRAVDRTRNAGPRRDTGDETRVLRPYEMDTTPLLRLPVTDEHPALYVPRTAALYSPDNPPQPQPQPRPIPPTPPPPAASEASVSQPRHSDTQPHTATQQSYTAGRVGGLPLVEPQRRRPRWYSGLRRREAPFWARLTVFIAGSVAGGFLGGGALVAAAVIW